MTNQDIHMLQLRVTAAEFARVKDLHAKSVAAGAVRPNRSQATVIRALIKTADDQAVVEEAARVRPVAWSQN